MKDRNQAMVLLNPITRLCPPGRKLKSGFFPQKNPQSEITNPQLK
jgi:hypothetical protein